MELSKVVLFILIAALVCAVSYIFVETRQMRSDIDRLDKAAIQLSAEDAALKEDITGLEASLEAEKLRQTTISPVCESQFPNGLYQLVTSTSYGPGSDEEYEINHVSVIVGEWNLNAGVAFGQYLIPAGFYFDYNGDGKIDTAIAARLAREIPLAGNTLANRLLADSTTYQNIYSVFSCEWQKAEFTTSDDMPAGISETSSMLWDLIAEYSESIEEWISTGLENGTNP